MSNLYIYRLDITYPVGSTGKDGSPNPLWRPSCWTQELEDSGRFRHRFGGAFKWPRQKLFRSREGAMRRAALFEHYGCIVEIVRSHPVEWESEVERVKRVTKTAETVISGMQQILEDTA